MIETHLTRSPGALPDRVRDRWAIRPPRRPSLWGCDLMVRCPAGPVGASDDAEFSPASAVARLSRRETGLLVRDPQGSGRRGAGPNDESRLCPGAESASVETRGTVRKVQRPEVHLRSLDPGRLPLRVQSKPLFDANILPTHGSTSFASTVSLDVAGKRYQPCSSHSSWPPRVAIARSTAGWMEVVERKCMVAR